MKKFISTLLVFVCFVAVFAGNFSTSISSLDLHPAILSGWCPTYIGLAEDYAKYLNDGNVLHVNLDAEVGIKDRVFFQNPKDGSYIEPELGDGRLIPVDVFNTRVILSGKYDLGLNWSFAGSYQFLYETRNNSRFTTGNVWPKNSKLERWMGGSEKQLVSSIDDWLDSFGVERNDTIYPELSTDSSFFHSLILNAEFNDMVDTMVSNNGFIAKAKVNYTPGFVNEQANFVSITADLIAAKEIASKSFANGRNMFACCVIDRLDLNCTIGNKVPTCFAHDYSLGRRVRGLYYGQQASEFSVVNNFELRFSSPELADGIFFRTDFFLDCGYGFGRVTNSEVKADNFVASVGLQEAIDYQDTFDLGLQVAYLLKGANMANPFNKLQIGVCFFLDF